MTLEIHDFMVLGTCYVPGMRPTSRIGTESTEDAEHKSVLPYMARPHLACEQLQVTRLVPRLRMKARFRPRYFNALMLVN